MPATIQIPTTIPTIAPVDMPFEPVDELPSVGGGISCVAVVTGAAIVKPLLIPAEAVPLITADFTAS